MEAAFKKLEQDNQNSVDNLIKWMKDSKIVDGKEVTEEKARQMFAEVSDSSKVELSKFQEVLGKLAKEQNKPADEFFKSLADGSTKFFNETVAAVSGAASVAAGGLKDAMKMK